MDSSERNWTPPSTFEEKLKTVFVPPAMYIRYRAWKEIRQGEKEIGLLPYLAPKDKVALDIGANKGVWSYFLSKTCRDVHAFEPNPKMFSVLNRCSAEHVTCHSTALSNENGESELLIPKRGSGGFSNQGGSLSKTSVTGGHQAVKVETKKLDAYDFDNIGFMKIDVEGFELAVLEGAKGTLKRCRPNLVIELEETHTGMPLQDMVSAVCAYGYEGFVLNGGILSKFEYVYKGVPVDDFGNYIFNFIFLPTSR